MEARAKVVRAFFTTDKVLRMMDRKTALALSKFGSYTRRTAQTSMKNRKKGSAPVGTPPFAKTKLIKRNVFFSYDEKTKSVVTGPTLLNGKKGYNVLKLLENGGTVTVVTRKEAVTKKYGGNPYMKPAFDANLPMAIKAFGE